MLYHIIALLALAYAKEMKQFLVFGKDDTGHFCDFALEPYESVSDVTIFEVIDGKSDQAIARVRLIPVGSPQSAGYSRIEIPPDLAVDGTLYSFQYTFEEGGSGFSENWTYDTDRKQFALASAVKRKFWKDTKFQIGAVIGGIVLGGLVGNMILRRMKKVRSTL